MQHNSEQPTFSPWSKEAHDQRIAEQYTPHESETFGGKPVLNYRTLDPMEDRIYINLPLQRSSGEMDEGWTQVATALSDRTDEHRAIMQMQKVISNPETGESQLATKWVDTERALERAAEYRRQKVETELADDALNQAGIVAPEAAQPVEQAPETELETYDRFVRESQAELKDLYAEQLRVEQQYGPNSFEFATVNNQVNEKQKDIGVYLKKARQLRGR